MSAEKFYGRILLVVVPILTVVWMVREAMHQWGVEAILDVIMILVIAASGIVLVEGIRRDLTKP